MRSALAICFAAQMLTLQGCGGGNSMAPTPAVVLFAPPTLDSAQTFSLTYVDYVSTSTDWIVQTITAVNPDGSFTYTESTAMGTPIVGTHFRPNQVTADSQGRVLSIVYYPGSSSAETCSYSPHGPGPDFPLTIGTTWQLTYTETCDGQIPVTYEQTGSVVDTETVMLAAGAFTAARLQSTISWSFGPASTASEAVTGWIDVTDGHPVQRQSQYTWAGPAGTVPTSALKQEASVLTAQ